MAHVEYISIEQFCSFHGCDVVVIQEFIDHGIIDLDEEATAGGLPAALVPRLEKALRLRLELGVNPAGIDIILNLLDRLDTTPHFEEW